jgi:cytochrome P450
MNAGMDPIRLGPARLDLSSLLPWRELVRATREVDELLYAEIAARRGRPSEREDVLSMLLQARDEEGREMSDVELHDEMLTLLLAGHETTATTLAWTVHQLCRHPDVLRRVVAEQRAGGEELLDAVIKETMRLIPIVALVGRKLARPARIGDTDLPAGVVAVACMWLAHRRADSWPEPERFDPDRFVGRKPDPYQFFPFGGGTRRCLGMAFAGYEMKVVLSTMLRRVAFEAASGEVRIIRRGITFAPSGGVPVRVQANV